MPALFPIDANLRPEGGTAITKTADFNGTALDLGAGYTPSPPQPMGLDMYVSALDFTTTDETYEFHVEESHDNSTWVATGCRFVVTATGRVQKIFGVSRRYLRLRLDVGGTTPSLTYLPSFGPVA